MDSPPRQNDVADEQAEEGAGQPAAAADIRVPPPMNPVDALAARDKAEREARNREALREQLFLDFMSMIPPPEAEEARDKAEDYVDPALLLRTEHQALLSHLHRAAEDARHHLRATTDTISEMTAAIDLLGKEPSITETRSARMLQKKAGEQIASFKRHEKLV